MLIQTKVLSLKGSRCGRADSVLNSHTTGPGFKTRLVRYFLLSFRLLTTMQHQVERSLVCVEGRGRISRSGLTQDIKMSSCVFQCDVPHQWIAQRQVGPVSVYCDGVGCRVLCLRHGISVWQHIGQSITATSRHRRDMTSDVSKRCKHKQTNKQNLSLNHINASCM